MAVHALSSPISTYPRRPYALRAGRGWLLAMRWSDLLFLHWPVAPAALRPHVPAAMELDCADGAAWLGITPFLMSRTRLRGLPPPPGVSRFAELNVRTYVRRGGIPGVWFFSLDAASLLAVTGSRIGFALPYFRARMRIRRLRDGWIEYRSIRRRRGRPPAMFAARYPPTSDVLVAPPGSLESFLTDRYCFYAATPRGHIERCDIDHAPWPLQAAQCDVQANTMAAAAGLAAPQGAPLLHFARRLDVVAWPPVRVA